MSVVALSCDTTEANILAACMVRPEIFEYLEDFGVDHFTNPRHMAAWAAMRRMQAAGVEIDPLGIVDDIAMHDIGAGTCLAEKVGAVWVGELMLRTTTYREEILFDRDVHWLRTLHDRRRAVCTAA